MPRSQWWHILKDSGEALCEICYQYGNQPLEKTACECPPCIVADSNGAEFTVKVCNYSVNVFDDLYDAVKLVVALYHVFFLHYGHGNSHCWCLEVFSRSFRMGCSEKTEDII